MIKKFKVKVNGKSYDVEVEEGAKSVGSEQNKTEADESLIVKKHRSVVVYSPGDVCEIIAPLPGSITEICIEEGKSVKTGEKILVLEAMKMENSILSPANGIVSKIFIECGVAVMGDQVLVTIDC